MCFKEVDISSKIQRWVSSKRTWRPVTDSFIGLSGIVLCLTKRDFEEI